jgi:hypothetical protein
MTTVTRKEHDRLQITAVLGHRPRIRIAAGECDRIKIVRDTAPGGVSSEMATGPGSSSQLIKRTDAMDLV